MDRAKIVADLEEYRSWLADELARTDKALESFGGGQLRIQEKPKRGSEGVPFEAKYDEPGHVLALREYRDAYPAGLALRELQDRLKAKEREYTDAAMRLVVMKLEKQGKLRKDRVEGMSFKFRYHYIPSEDS